MRKLIKYEWKKQMFSKLVIGGILLVLTLLYVAGMLLHKELWQGIAMAGLVFLGTFASIYVGIESLLVLNRDIRTKESHMLFMVPRHAGQILCAKILAAILQILLTMFMFGAAFFICFTAYMAANERLSQTLSFLRSFVENELSVEISWKMALLLLTSMFVAWINMIASGFAAIISVRTVLSRTKLAGLIAFGVFLLLNWGTNWMVGKINGLSSGPDTEMVFYAAGLAVTAAVTALLLFFSGWMAERKLSV